MSITSDVEIGSGLSSSAALIGAVLGAAGAIWAAAGRRPPGAGGAMSITSDVEIGSGLSSSAALIGGGFTGHRVGYAPATSR